MPNVEEFKLRYELEEFLDMEEYKKEHPSDPYCNFYVPGWRDGSNKPGDWIMQGK